ncbi:MAG TPA: hypothetical protein VFM75_11850 [Modicisalibacter sp.]|nr:hypothetical protein [Modicisalibacter sp.]
MFETQTISVSIDRPWLELYEAWWHPEAFPRWASGLSQSTLERHGERWKAEGPEGLIEIAFTAHNAFGVMDHWVDLGNGHEVYIPLRIIANGDGAEVQLTLFRQSDMSEAKFVEDQTWVKRDLLTLKDLSER